MSLRKNSCAYDIAHFRRVWACIVERRILDEPVEKSARLQVGHKVGEPAPLHDLRFEISAYVQLPAKCRDVKSLCRRKRL